MRYDGHISASLLAELQWDAFDDYLYMRTPKNSYNYLWILSYPLKMSYF